MHFNANKQDGGSRSWGFHDVKLDEVMEEEEIAR